MERYSYGGNNRPGIFQRAPMAGARNKIKKGREGGEKKEEEKSAKFQCAQKSQITFRPLPESIHGLSSLSLSSLSPSLSLTIGLAMPAAIRHTVCG